jgi:hypothetical protein
VTESEAPSSEQDSTIDLGDGAAHVRPSQVLLPGDGDARALLACWFARRAFYPLILLGTIGAFVSGDPEGRDIDYTDAGEVGRDLVSPLTGLVLGAAVRLLAALGAWFLALRVARSRERTLAPRTGFGHTFGRLMDLRQVVRAYKALRWTHHVRQEAIRRLAPAGHWLWRLDRRFDIATIVLGAVAGAFLVSSAF